MMRGRERARVPTDLIRLQLSQRCLQLQGLYSVCCLLIRLLESGRARACGSTAGCTASALVPLPSAWAGVWLHPGHEQEQARDALHHMEQRV